MTTPRSCAVCNADCRHKKVGATYQKRVLCLTCHAHGWRFDWNTGQVMQWLRCDACRVAIASDKAIRNDQGQHFCCLQCATYTTTVTTEATNES